MELIAEAIVFLLWSVFFVVTAMGVVVEYRRSKGNQRSTQRLGDDDPVYLVELHDA